MKVIKNIAIGALLLAAGVYAGKLLFGRSSDIPAPVPAYFSQSGSAGDSTGMAAWNSDRKNYYGEVWKFNSGSRW